MLGRGCGLEAVVRVLNGTRLADDHVLIGQAVVPRRWWLAREGLVAGGCRPGDCPPDTRRHVARDLVRIGQEGMARQGHVSGACRLDAKRNSIGIRPRAEWPKP